MKSLLTLAGLWLATAIVAQAAELKLAAVFSDHMLLQRDQALPVWGWADPGQPVTVEFAGQKKTATADAGGRWMARLDPLPASAEPRELVVAGTHAARITVHDVLVGEVWLCSGQSNMSYLLTTHARTPNETTGPEILAAAQLNAAAAHGALRYFAVRGKYADSPLDDVQGKWSVATPDTVGGCFALSWHFAVTLYHRLNVPVGVIDSAIGGTAIEPWTPFPELAACPVGPATIKRYQAKLDGVSPELRHKFEADLAAWTQRYPSPELQQQNLASRPVLAEHNANMPARLYNGMIHGLEPYPLRGFLWFQGDGNFGNPQEYGELVKTLIRAWRTHWHDDTLPFYYVEMQNYAKPQERPVEPNPMSLIREAQQAALQLPATDVAAALDQGIDRPNYEAHFPDKQALGERLAGLALNNLYGQSGLVHSPQLKSYAVEGNKVRLQFDHAEGLRLRGSGGLKGFAIRAADGDWTWAQGRIEGQAIVVWSDRVSAPAAVRYAWAFNPLLSVENRAGLPLRPFRTDTQSDQ